MHLLHAILAQSTTTTTKSSSSSSKGSSWLPLIVILLLFGGVYVLFLRPRTQRMRQQQQASRDVAIGDPVLTAGGIHGKVVALDGDVAEVEVAPGVVMTFLRRAVSLHPDARGTSRPVTEIDDDDDWGRPPVTGLEQEPDPPPSAADD